MNQWTTEAKAFHLYTFLFFILLSINPLLGQTPYPEVVAINGDGIYTLLRKNGLDPATHFTTFLELNKKNIGKDSSLFVGRKYRLPGPDSPLTQAAKNTATSPTPLLAEPAVFEYPLFGKKYSRVEVKDQQLKGAVYYLVAGHGGPDPGAVGKYGPYYLGEDEYAYDVTLRLARKLMEHGATVHMIIQDPNDGIRDDNVLELDTDEVCYPNQRIPLNHKLRLRQRTEAVNALFLTHKGAYQRMLSIHVDSRSKGENIDVFFYHHENSSNGKKLAESIHQTITSKYNRHQPNRDYFGNVSARSSLYVVKYSHPPTVFIELGNIMNDRDQRRFVIPDNRQALANWISEGILADYRSRDTK